MSGLTDVNCANLKKMIKFVQIPIEKEELEHVLEYIRETKRFVNGEYTKKLEDEFSRYIGSKYAIAVSNGTDGLFLSYLALDLTFGRKILTTPLTFIATVSTIIHVGSIPVFSDVDLDGNIYPKKVERDVDGISVVHLYGNPVNLDYILEIVNDLDIPLIEDASHAHGAEYKGRKIGVFGDVAVFSLYPTKLLPAGGWGGIITTNRDDLAEKIFLLRAHGELRVKLGVEGAYEYIRLGYNMRISEFEAGVAYYQIKKLNWIIDRRRRNAKRLTELLADIKGIKTPGEKPGRKHVYYIYNIIIDPKRVGWHRDEFVKALNMMGIAAQRGYHTPLHRTQLFKNINNPTINHFARLIRYPEYSKMRFPTAEKLASNSIWLPLHHKMTEEDIEFVANTIRRLVEKRSS